MDASSRELLGEKVVELIDRRSTDSLVRLLNENPGLMNTIFRGKTPLSMAVFVGDMRVVQCLLDLGADIELSERIHESPLFVAIRHCKVEFVQALLSYGANANASEEDGQTPILQTAQVCGPKGWPIAEMLIQHGATLDLNSAVYFARIEEIEKLLIATSNAVALAPFPNDLIYAAVTRNSPQILRLLLAHGAEVNGMARDGAPALFRAVEDATDIEILAILLENGADVHAVDCFGEEILKIVDRDKSWISADKLSLLKRYSRKT